MKLTLYKLPDGLWHLRKTLRHGVMTECAQEIPNNPEMLVVGGQDSLGNWLLDPPRKEVCERCFHFLPQETP